MKIQDVTREYRRKKISEAVVKSIQSIDRDIDKAVVQGCFQSSLLVNVFSESVYLTEKSATEMSEEIIHEVITHYHDTIKEIKITAFYDYNVYKHSIIFDLNWKERFSICSFLKKNVFNRIFK